MAAVTDADMHDESGQANAAGQALAERTDSTPGLYFFEPTPDPRRQDGEDTVNLLDYWRILVKRRWTIITVLVIAVTAAVIASFVMTPIYRAGLTLQIERELPKIVEYRSVEPVESNNYQAYVDFYQTQYELLKSRTLAQRVIERLALVDNPVFTGARQGPPVWQPLLDWITRSIGPRETDGTDKREPDWVKKFHNNLAVQPVRDSRLVKIRYDSPDPELAARIANTLADTFIAINLERRFEASSYASKFLEERLQQIKAKLEDSERDLAEYARREQVISIDEQHTISTRTLEEINTALAKAEAARIQAEALNRQTQGSGQGLTPILESKVIQDLKALRAQLEAEYEDKLKFYKPAYPMMLQLQGRIQEVQRKIDDEIRNIRSAIRADYEIAKVNESLLRAKLDDVKKEVLALQQRQIRYNILRREVDTNRQLYDGLLQRYKEVGVAGGVGTNNISIVDKAEVPPIPVKPRLVLNIALAIVIGLLGGVVLALVFEALDDTVKQADDLERIIGLPTLGLIPQEAPKNRHEPIALLAYQDPRCAFAEAYRSVRTALQFATSEGPPRIIAVTSPIAQEGKSTTSLSLAIHFAQAGKKVLLIDADLRNPILHRFLQLENDLGLTHYLAGNAEPGAIAQPALLPNLFVVTSGASPPNPAELLSTAKMLALLSLAGERFDQVILDCPPVLGLADALILGNMAGGAILVVAAGSTRRGAAQNALRRLKGARVRLIGSVLTKLDARGSPYEYYHEYYYNDASKRKRLTA